MKLLLYSDFSHMPLTEVLALTENPQNKTCLFCTYADEEAAGYNARARQHISKVFGKIVDLTPNYNFKDKIDCVFVNGGFNFELSYKLKKYNQFDKLKQLVLQGALYIGNSAGSVMAGEDFYFTRLYEPPRFEMDMESNRFGFGFLHKDVLVHTSKYRFSDRLNKLIEDKDDYKNYIKNKLKQPNHVKIPNNAVLIVTDEQMRLKKYPWQKIVKEFTK